MLIKHGLISQSNYNVIMNIQFTKMQGAGNDFIVINGIDEVQHKYSNHPNTGQGQLPNGLNVSSCHGLVFEWPIGTLISSMII